MKKRNLESKEKKLIIISFSIFWIMSLIFFSIFFFWILPNHTTTIKNKNRIYTDAKITSIYKQRSISGDGYTYDVIVSYKVDGVIYEGELGTYVPTYQFIKDVKIYYDKNDPTKIGTNDIAYFYYGFVGIILLFNIIIYKKINNEIR